MDRPHPVFRVLQCREVDENFRFRKEFSPALFIQLKLI
jgi:hypothetical protein